MTVRVHIDRLVVDRGAGDPAALAAAVREAVARQAASMPPANRHIAAVDAGVAVPGADGISRAVAGAFGRVTR